LKNNDLDTKLRTEFTYKGTQLKNLNLCKMSNIYKYAIILAAIMLLGVTTLFIYNKATEKPPPAIEVKKFSQKDLDSVVNRTLEIKAIEHKKELEDKVLADKQADTLHKKTKLVQEWRSLITAKSDNITSNRGISGGYDKIKISISNQSEFNLTSVKVLVSIYRFNGELCYKGFLNFENVAPKNMQETEFTHIECGQKLILEVFEAYFKEIDLNLK